MKKTTKILAAGALAGIFLAFTLPVAAADLSSVTPDNFARVLEKMSADTFRSEDGFTLPYRIYKSPAYRADDPQNPAVLFLYLHGAGGRGSDNEQQIKDQPTLVNYLVSDSADKALSDLPYIVVAPQCPSGSQWVDVPFDRGSYDLERGCETRSIRAVYELLESLCENENADSGNVVLYGISMGGYGVWDLAIRYPKFARAVVPISGGGDPSIADRLDKSRIWAFHCEDDSVVPVSGSREMIDALKTAGIDAKYTEFPTKAHNAWTPAMEVKNPTLLEWLTDGIDYEVETEAVGDGTVSESKRLKRGWSFDVSITPAEGGELLELYIDGIKQETLTNKYTFSNIKAPHSLKAVFSSKDAQPQKSSSGMKTVGKVMAALAAAVVVGGAIIAVAVRKKQKK